MKNTLALSAAAAALLSTSVASAGVIELRVSATLTAVAGAGACSPTCKLGGDIVINNSAPDPGMFVSADITATGFSPSVGPFTTPAGIGTFSGVFTTLAAKDAAGDVLSMVFTTPTAGSLVGFTGGGLVNAGDPGTSGVEDGHAWTMTSGSLTAIPEPSTWALMALGFGALGIAGWRSRGRSVLIVEEARQ
jgi:hypothetical protein